MSENISGAESVMKRFYKDGLWFARGLDCEQTLVMQTVSGRVVPDIVAVWNIILSNEQMDDYIEFYEECLKNLPVHLLVDRGHIYKFVDNLLVIHYGYSSREACVNPCYHWLPFLVWLQAALFWS